MRSLQIYAYPEDGWLIGAGRCGEAECGWRTLGAIL